MFARKFLSWKSLRVWHYFPNWLYFDFKVLNEDVYIVAAGEMKWQLMMATAGEWINYRKISIHASRGPDIHRLI